VRAYRNYKTNQIVIKALKDSEEPGEEICRLPTDRLREAMAIVALPDLIQAARPSRRAGSR
jgi:hypothetical protein